MYDSDVLFGTDY